MRPVGISIGDFNFRVSFYSVTEGARDAFGNPTLSESSEVSRWANVAYKEQGISDSNGVEYQNYFDITVRKPLTVNVGDRVVFDSQNLLIVNVDNSDKTHYKIKAVGIAQ